MIRTAPAAPAWLRILAGWVAANTLAGLVFVIVSEALGVMPSPGVGEFALPARLLLFGALFGIAQWFVVARGHETSVVWLVVSPVVGALAFVFATAAALFYALLFVSRPVGLGVSGAVAGTCVGIAQAVLVRPTLKKPLAMVLSSAVGGAVTASFWIDALGSPEPPILGAAGGTIYGLVTGFGLWLGGKDSK